jgi:hypothetical protein
MDSPQLITKILPIVTIILAFVFFIALKLTSRFKSRALGKPDGKNIPDFRIAVNHKKQNRDRIKLKCPALVERPRGIMKTSVKEITLNGAFLTCPNPLPIGEAFQVKIFIANHHPLKFDADVLWNNRNVSVEKIVSRGMKIRFLQLSNNERLTLEKIISNPLTVVKAAKNSTQNREDY